MRYLLDTHTLAWAVGDPTLLSETAKRSLRDPKNELFVSPVSIWEMSIKHYAGKWSEVAPFMDEARYAEFSQRLNAQELVIHIPYTRLAGQFKVEHKDPFDRLLAAQALLEGVTLMSKDKVFDQFPVIRVW